MGAILRGPLHVTDYAAEGEFSRGIAAGELLKYPQHALGIEAAALEVGIGRAPKLQLTAPLGGIGIDICCHQTAQMIVLLLRRNNVHRFVPAGEAVLNEGQQHAIPFVRTVEERADVPDLGQLRAGEGNRGRERPQGYLLGIGAVENIRMDRSARQRVPASGLSLRCDDRPRDAIAAQARPGSYAGRTHTRTHT